MAFGINRVELIGRLGADVVVNHLASGGRVANLSIATDESFLSRQTGERVDRVEWHRVVTFQDGLISMLEKHAKKGRLVHAEGKLQTRRWTKDGEDSDRFSTEILVVPGYRLQFLDKRPNGGRRSGAGGGRGARAGGGRRVECERRRRGIRRQHPVLGDPSSPCHWGRYFFGTGPFFVLSTWSQSPRQGSDSPPPGPRVNPEHRARPFRPRGRARGKGWCLAVPDYRATRAQCANPFGVLRFAPAGTRNETALARLVPATRATVAPRSLRSLVRPHHSRTSPGHSFRPRWLPCARVSQQSGTARHPRLNGFNSKLKGASTMTFDIDTFESQSMTATVCENAQLFGATPERGEFDPRDIFDRDEAVGAVTEAFAILAESVAPDGFQLADEREQLLWGIVNAFDAQVRRLDRSVDRLTPELRDLQAAQDGTEVKSRELELTTGRAQNLGDRRDAFEQMRDAAAEHYRAETGEVWRPRRGSHTSQTGALTSAAIDARDFIRARKDRETKAHLPSGTLVAIAGGKDVRDPGAVTRRLDQTRAKYDDLVIVHGGGPGTDRLAAQWAETNGVDQVVCKPDWTRHGRAAPFRRNDEMLNLLPKGLIAFEGNGITANLVDKAKALGIPVLRG